MVELSVPIVNVGVPDELFIIEVLLLSEPTDKSKEPISKVPPFAVVKADETVIEDVTIVFVPEVLDNVRLEYVPPATD